jgi:hypothetical protein
MKSRTYIAYYMMRQTICGNGPCKRSPVKDLRLVYFQEADTSVLIFRSMSDLTILRSVLRQLAEEVVHGAQHFCFVGAEDVVIRVRQTDDLG